MIDRLARPSLRRADPKGDIVLMKYPAIANTLVPRIWWFEIRNLLIVNERRGRLNERKSNRALGILRQLPIELGSADQ